MGSWRLVSYQMFEWSVIEPFSLNVLEYVCQQWLLQATILNNVRRVEIILSSLIRWDCSTYWTWRSIRLLEQMVKRLRRLKFLSVRRCGDVRLTVCKLPKSIVKIKKLQYIWDGSMAEIKKKKPIGTSRTWLYQSRPCRCVGSCWLHYTDGVNLCTLSVTEKKCHF